MKSASKVDIKDYYRQLTEIDIGKVAHDLLDGRITKESGKLLQCDCPHHASQSHLSLHVMLDRQGWYCFGCGVGGDVLQLVEFVQSGQVTKGTTGVMPESHRAARDYLAERCGLPPLAQHGLSADQVKEMEESRAFELRVQGVLTALTEYYHERLLADEKALAWLREKYGLREETITSLKIGLAANDSWKDGAGAARLPVIAHLTNRPEKYSQRELAASGAFHPTGQDQLMPFFDRRIIFPYWSRGRVVFLIGRKTPWTPDSPYEQGKYKKMPIHDEKKHAHISSCVNNGYLYNEDILLTKPDRIIITEGVTDCISLIEHGFPTISPVTVQIREADWERLIPKLNRVKTVYICQDNEVSEAGLKGAFKMAETLAKEGITTRVATLPLEEKHKTARERLLKRFNWTVSTARKAIDITREDMTEEMEKEAERLLAESKIDVNEFFLAGHTAADFEKVLESAQSPIEFGIQAISLDLCEELRNRALDPVLAQIAGESELEQGRLLKIIQARFGKQSLPIAALKSRIKTILKEQKQQSKGRSRKLPLIEGAEPGSCKEAINEAVQESMLANGGAFVDWVFVTGRAFEWFQSNGARFFVTTQGQPFMYFENQILWMDSGDRGRHRRFAATMFEQTGLVSTVHSGRTLFEVLSNLAVQQGEVCDHFCWLHTDRSNLTVYFNLNNAEHEVAKITPEGVSIITNGNNDDGVILESSPKMQPLHFLPEFDLKEGDRLLSELLLDNLSCDPADRYLVVAWISCLLLLDIVGTKPMLRFEGSTQSGKTTATKLLSMLIYGKEEQKRSTDAANYTDAARNPLVMLDNIEVKQLTEELKIFILTAVTGIVREKRRSGTDTENVQESTRCLLNTSGIEPVGAELSEILSRSFVIQFNTLFKRKDHYFFETRVLQTLKTHRDKLVSTIILKTSKVLALIRDGALERVVDGLEQKFGSHSKQRCNDFLALMYLTILAANSDEDIEKGLQDVDSIFLQRICILNEVTDDTARESNPIATALSALFKAYHHALKADRECSLPPGGRTNKSLFLERYQIEFADDSTFKGAAGRDIFVALKRVTRDFNLSFPMETPQQFIQRFFNDLKFIMAAGFEVQSHELAQRKRVYDIRFNPEGNAAETPSTEQSLW